MTKMSETYYLAIRVKDAKMIVKGSVTETCMHCGDKVVIDPQMYVLAKDALGILCLPCVTEKTGKTLMQLFVMNADVMAKILKERFGEK